MISLQSVVALFALATRVNASAFLGAHAQYMQKAMVEESVQLSLRSSSSDLRSLEEELRPLYAVLPKTEDGKLEPAVVRYAVHRYFSQKHGWHVKGLRSVGGAWNASSSVSVSIIKEQAPSYIQSLFEQRLQSGGLGLHDLAAFVVTLSDLIRRDVIGVLEQIYEAKGLSRDLRQPQEAFDEVVDLYLAAHINGSDSETAFTADSLVSKLRDVEMIFLDWENAQTWGRDLRRTLEFARQSRRNPFRAGVAFESAVEFVGELAHRFGSTQDGHCSSLKQMLVDMEHQGTGRVSLSKFYSGYQDSTWPFYETVEYLRALGALDEADPRMPSVIIPNYIGGQGNCLEPSGFYSVCCRDECEHLLAQVEQKIAAPTATPALVAELVSSLPSDTVEAPRNLSAAQLSRLEEIAQHHGGQVPLHGRLFSQWMHHAYPRECPYPHVTGTTKGLTSKEWQREMGELSQESSDAEMEVFVRSAVVLPDASPDTLPWSVVEELVASRELMLAARRESSTRTSLRAAALLAAVAFAVLPVLRTSKLSWGGPAANLKETHLV